MNPKIVSNLLVISILMISFLFLFPHIANADEFIFGFLLCVWVIWISNCVIDIFSELNRVKKERRKHLKK